jgi:VanZ family protein
MPYDFRSVPTWIIERKLARMSLVPLAGYASGSDLNALNDLLVNISLSVPLGVIGAFFLRPNQWTATTTVASLLAATILFGVIEAGQLFLPSRWFDPSDVLVGVGGTAAGLWIGRWLRGDP